MATLATFILGGASKYSYTVYFEINLTFSFFLAALFALDVNLLGLIVAFLLGFPINVVINSMLQLLTAGILTCLVLSSVLYHLADYVEDWRLNPRGNTGVCPIK